MHLLQYLMLEFAAIIVVRKELMNPKVQIGLHAIPSRISLHLGPKYKFGRNVAERKQPVQIQLRQS